MGDSPRNKALILGLTGMDGSYLADFLLEKGYEVHGVIRRVSTPNTTNISHLFDKVQVHEGDITDLSSLLRIFKEVQPDEIYNLAAQSFVGTSWNQPIVTANITGMGALNVFEAVRQVCPSAKVYQASSSEMFDGKEFPQNEQTRFKPKSPYGVSKLFAHESARIYRESYNLFIACGILFNHESPRRGIEFVTQKIVETSVRQIVAGEGIQLRLGNLEAKRDWSHAKDFVRGMWMMLQQDKPDDFVLSSGETHSVKEFVDKTYEGLGIELFWDYTDPEFPFARSSNRIVRVLSVPEFYRPNEVATLLGDSTKAREQLKWTPTITFDGLVVDMINTRVDMYAK